MRKERSWSPNHVVARAESAGRQAEELTRFHETGLTLPSRSTDEPDSRLVELVRILARRAARQWFARQLEAQRQANEADPKRSRVALRGVVNHHARIG